MIIRILFSASFLLAVSCGESDPTIEDHFDSSGIVSTTKNDSMDTSYVIRYNRLYVEIHKHGILFSKRNYDLSLDSVFNADRSINHTSQEYMVDQPGRYREYYSNGQIRYEHYISNYDGMGGTTGEIKYYDSLGHLDSSFYNRDYLPQNASGHLDVCGVVSASYYRNGKLTRIIHHDIHYEGLTQCPCGTWEFYDSAGKLLRTEKFKKCGDGKTDCEYIY